ncbi:MAG: SUMF1/EgtB/PvdO family nonheme iron enzyme [Planctomycetaceae bacterium]
MRFCRIPAGSFKMGCEESSVDLEKDGFGWVHVQNLAEEAPRHEVTISQSLFMGAHVVTKEQFTRFVRATGFATEAEISGSGGRGYIASIGQNQKGKQFNWKKTGFAQEANHPVVNVSWNDAVAFCDWLSQEEGQIYRLPTEAEWEYCCRAGTSSRFFTGDSIRTLQGFANVADDSFQKEYWKVDFTRFPCFQFKDGWPFTSPVGWFKPNQFGLYDMLGNVLEWCSDWYSGDYYTRSCLDDPPGPTSGAGRVIRGGGGSLPPFFLRSSCRGFNDPCEARNDTGFRVVLVPENL